MNLKIEVFMSYIRIETSNSVMILQNIDMKNISIKKEDNGKPIILVEAKQQ